MTGERKILFSLIVPTLGRCDEVRRLFLSMEAQSCRDFEVILVDQNADDLLDDVCRDFARKHTLVRLKIEPRGVSSARNHGLGFANGAIVNFPDDDCEFTPNLLARVANVLMLRPETDAIFARAVDPVSRESSVTKFAARSQAVTAANLYRTTVEFTMFARRALFKEVGLMDENLGVGTFFGAEEGADFVLRALYMGKRLQYDATLLVLHPQKIAHYGAAEQKRAYEYGKGFGRLSVKHLRLYQHPHAAMRFLYFQIRAAAAALLYLCLLKPERCIYYLKLICGRFTGACHSWSAFQKKDATVIGVDR